MQVMSEKVAQYLTVSACEAYEDGRWAATLEGHKLAASVWAACGDRNMWRLHKQAALHIGNEKQAWDAGEADEASDNAEIVLSLQREMQEVIEALELEAA